MNKLVITLQDEELTEHAKAVIARYYRPDHYHVGAALRTPLERSSRRRMSKPMWRG